MRAISLSILHARSISKRLLESTKIFLVASHHIDPWEFLQAFIFEINERTRSAALLKRDANDACGFKWLQ
jgi:hypothetical protein